MQDQKKLNFRSNFTKIRTNFKCENKMQESRDIRETVTFLDPGFHEMKHEKIDGGVKDRKKTWYNTMWVDKITNALEEVLGVEWMVVA